MYQEDKNWIHNYVNGGKVLDIGCSDGSFLSLFDNKLWDRHGIDLTRDALEIAENREITTYLGKVWEEDVGADYDLVILRGTIEHCRDPETVLKKCSEILKPGGILYITATPCGNSFAFNVYRNKWRLFMPYNHIHFFTVDLLTNILEHMNLNLIARHSQYDETPYANPERDFEQIFNDIAQIKLDGGVSNVGFSPPFPGSMLTAAWKKTEGNNV
jgi:SAM-dependent methyltransferase